MYDKAYAINLDSDEGGFELHFLTNEHDRLVINIQGCDLDAFYDQVKARIGPYLQERDEARREWYAQNRAIDGSGYALSDPKHPEFHSIHADIWDARAGK